MPASTRRRTSAGPTAKAKSKSQSTLAFHGKGNNRVTKPGVGHSTKDGKVKKEDHDGLEAQEVKLEEEDDDVSVKAEEETIVEQVQVQPETALTQEEIAAGKITEAQIKRYWAGKTAQRKAPRVHQEGLSVHEMVCREFDMDGRFGPCMGIPRIRRWKRANKLRLQPPVEVLAVLLREEREGSGKVQRAYVDELMSSRTVEV